MIKDIGDYNFESLQVSCIIYNIINHKHITPHPDLIEIWWKILLFTDAKDFAS